MLGADGLLVHRKIQTKQRAKILNMLKSSIEDVNTEQNDAEKSVRELAVKQRKIFMRQ
jgi:flagellar hook-basal body complex protein FliE